MDDTHGHALVYAGLISAPTCVSCHGGHDVKSRTDPTSPVHRNNVSEDCGKCHVGILEQYRDERARHDRAGPCRRAGERQGAGDVHRLPPAARHRVRGHPLQAAASSRPARGCHEDHGTTYKGTYHGRVSKIGFGGVASCDECHTAHHILPSSDPASALLGGEPHGHVRPVPRGRDATRSPTTWSTRIRWTRRTTRSCTGRAASCAGSCS